MLIATQAHKFGQNTIKWIAFASAFSVGILTAFGFGEKANNFRAAWRMLNTAVISYESLENYSLEKLINVYSEAEKIIGDVNLDIK